MKWERRGAERECALGLRRAEVTVGRKETESGPLGSLQGVEMSGDVFEIWAAGCRAEQLKET